MTSRITESARVLAPALPELSIRCMAAVLAKCGPLTPVLATVIRRNMESAGVLRSGLPARYFQQVAAHFEGAIHIIKYLERPEKVGEMARARVGLDQSVEHLRTAMQLEKGVVVAAPHVCNYLLTLARLGQEFPLCVYLRWSDNERKQDLKRAWCQASGLEVILEPANASDPTSRAAACVEALRQKKLLVMTPDIAQKNTKGIAARLFRRTVYLPSGPASIAMLAEAPIVPVFGKLVQNQHMITAYPAIMVEAIKGRGERKLALGNAMQKWALGFEKMLMEFAEIWFLWGDSRWTRVFSGDPKYSYVDDRSSVNDVASLSNST